MRAGAFALVGALALIAIVPVVAAEHFHRTDLLASFGNHFVRYSWLSRDGAFDGVSADGCEVVTASGDLNGNYRCLAREMRLLAATPNADGTTAYAFEVAGVYGSPYVFEVFGPNAPLSVGRGLADFRLRVHWTHASHAVTAEVAEIQPGSRVGSLSNAGPLPAMIAQRTANDDVGDLARAVADLVDCIETKC